MSKQCATCGKTANNANKVCFSHKHHKHLQFPNLQTVKAKLPNGSVKRVRVCTSCIRANKVVKAV